MQTLDIGSACSQCSRALIDAGDELVCPSCGIVKEKVVVEAGWNGTMTSSDFGKYSLGSFMGTVEGTWKERYSRGLSKTNSNYDYLKVISDYTGREEGADRRCFRMIERIGEKLSLPRVVILQAATIAKKVLKTEYHKRRVTMAAVSAYSLIAACKVGGVASVSVMEVIEAHSDLGRRVRSSSVIQLALESPIKTAPRRPEEYLSRVLGRLSQNGGLIERLRREGVQQTAFFSSLRDTAKVLISEIGEAARLGRRPCALAASAVYTSEVILARLESRRRRITQKELAECGDTAEYTIRGQCAQIFMPVAEDLLREMRPVPLPASAS